MKKTLILIASVSLIILALAWKISECGGSDRWDVKVLTDKEAALVKYKPRITTIKKLVALITPLVHGNTPRMKMEMQVYKVECNIVEYIKEDDKDYHLVITDKDDTMIAEIPDADCPDAQKSKHHKEFAEARSTFELARKDKSYKKHRWRIYGVAFVDIKHGTPPKGCPANRIELHPVLKMEVIK